MSGTETVFGAVLGATVATVGLRVAAHAKRRGVSPFEVIADLPDILAEDAKMLGEAARSAVTDGHRAADRARIEFDMQVVAHARRNRSTDD